jgi:hypothetical protein
MRVKIVSCGGNEEVYGWYNNMIGQVVDVTKGTLHDYLIKTKEDEVRSAWNCAIRKCDCELVFVSAGVF